MSKAALSLFLGSNQGLEDPKCYHEFCRLLARLKCNYQLSELIKLEYYPQFLQLIAKFTITSLRVRPLDLDPTIAPKKRF